MTIYNFTTIDEFDKPISISLNQNNTLTNSQTDKISVTIRSTSKLILIPVSALAENEKTIHYAKSIIKEIEGINEANENCLYTKQLMSIAVLWNAYIIDI